MYVYQFVPLHKLNKLSNTNLSTYLQLKSLSTSRTFYVMKNYHSIFLVISADEIHSDFENQSPSRSILDILPSGIRFSESLINGHRSKARNRSSWRTLYSKSFFRLTRTLSRKLPDCETSVNLYRCSSLFFVSF